MEYVNLTFDAYSHIFKYLDNDAILNCILIYKRHAELLNSLPNFILNITIDNYDMIYNSYIFNNNLPIKNISIIDDIQHPKFYNCTNLKPLFTNNIKYINFENIKFSNQNIIDELLNPCTNIEKINFVKCKFMKYESNKIIDKKFNRLIKISFHECNKGFFTIWKKQSNIEELEVINYKITWVGFDHEEFIDLLNSINHIGTLKLTGQGTSSFLDNVTDNMNFKIDNLITDNITHNWYVGLANSPRLKFLKKLFENNIKSIKINNLPYDFDGGDVLKYILNRKDIKFYYKNTLLISEGQKQPVIDFSCTEIQMKAMVEMFKHFTIKSFTLYLNNTDIASDEVEAIININPTFNNVNVDNVISLNIIDISESRNIFGVYLGLYRWFKNIITLTIKTNDSNIIVILDEILRFTRKVEFLNLRISTKKNIKIDNICNSIKKLKFIKSVSVNKEYVSRFKILLSTNITTIDVFEFVDK